MSEVEVIQFVKKLFDNCVKGQIQIDFSGDCRRAQIRITNISINELNKLQRLIVCKD